MQITREQIQRRLEPLAETESALADPAVLGNPAKYREALRRHASLKRLESAAHACFSAEDELDASRNLLQEAGEDAEMAAMAQEEIARLEATLPELQHKLMACLLPDDPLEGRAAMFELRAGTGGEEAALFAADLFRMYSRYCESHGYTVSVMDASPTEIGGYKEIIFTVTGENAYGRFQFESGGHRVQRVPVTEAQGRIHTSAATLVVLPEADEEDDLVIPESELRIDIFCAGGHGGQGVNTTYSAIRITHLPTGLVAQCQDERSQHKNKAKAMKVLRSRILDARRQAADAAAGATRLGLRGSGDRSQRIRTYNFPQNRLTDHRINLTLYSLDRVMEGEMDELLDALHAHDIEQRLQAQGLGKNAQ
ncbi:MAG: peptide chain release factor 1 [Kiritimatiellia bacterium]